MSTAITLSLTIFVPDTNLPGAYSLMYHCVRNKYRVIQVRYYDVVVIMSCLVGFMETWTREKSTSPGF
jgi:hypothetical protein